MLQDQFNISQYEVQQPTSSHRLYVITNFNFNFQKVDYL